MRTFRRTKDRKEQNKKTYIRGWGGFKSHKWKKKNILRVEISDALRFGDFTKKELIEILDTVREKGMGLPPLGIGEKVEKNKFLTRQDMQI